jgi:tetratricopeptide repeat protein
VRVFAGAIAAALAALAFARFRKAWEPLAPLGLAAFLVLLFDVLEIRPQLFTILLLLLLDRGVGDSGAPRTKAGWAAALGCVVLAVNLHGAGLLLPLFAGAVAGGEWLRRRLVRSDETGRIPSRALFGFAAGAVLASAVHPQGIAIHRYALEASAFGKRWVTEWFPFTLYVTRGSVAFPARVAALAAFAGAAGLGLALLLRLGPRGALLAVPPARWLLLAGSGALAFRAMKFLWLGFFALDFALRAGKALAGAREPRVARPLFWVALAGAVGMASFLRVHPSVARMPSTMTEGSYFREPVDRRSVPLAAARFVREAGLEGNLFNFYGWGGYLIHALGPRLPVFVDGRMFEYGESVFRDGFALRDWRKAPDRAREVVARRGIGITIFDRAWCPPGGCFGPEWVLVYRDLQAAVFVRAGTENERRARERLGREGVPLPFTEYGAAQGSPPWARENAVLPEEDLRRLEGLLARGDAASRMEAARLFDAGGELFLGSVEAALLDAVSIQPGHPHAHFNLGVARARMGRVPEARESLRRHLEIVPGDVEARALLARLERGG